MKKDWKFVLIILFFLILIGVGQSISYSPLTPKANSISTFKLNPKLIPKAGSVSNTNSTQPLSESQIEEKHGRLELVRLKDGKIIRGAIFEQGKDFIRIETTTGVQKIPTEQIEDVEIIQ